MKYENEFSLKSVLLQFSENTSALHDDKNSLASQILFIYWVPCSDICTFLTPKACER